MRTFGSKMSHLVKIPTKPLLKCDCKRRKILGLDGSISWEHPLRPWGSTLIRHIWMPLLDWNPSQNCHPPNPLGLEFRPAFFLLSIVEVGHESLSLCLCPCNLLEFDMPFMIYDYNGWFPLFPGGDWRRLMADSKMRLSFYDQDDLWSPYTNLRLRRQKLLSSSTAQDE